MENITQFFDAILHGDAAEVQALVAANPTLAEARNQDGATPALWAIYTRHADLAPVVLAGRAPDFFEACALGELDRVAQGPYVVPSGAGRGRSAGREHQSE